MQDQSISNHILVLGAYTNLVLLALKAVLFVIAEFVVRPQGLKHLSYPERIRASFIKLPNEEDVFGGERQRILLFRAIWFSILGLLLLRILIGFGMNHLEV